MLKCQRTAHRALWLRLNGFEILASGSSYCRFAGNVISIAMWSTLKLSTEHVELSGFTAELLHTYA
jgi:hypothetical protein